MDVYEALKARWEADDTLRGIRGPYRDRKPPSGSPFPYCVFKSLPAAKAITTTRGTIWQLAYSFSVFDASPELCSAHLDKIQAAFNDWLPGRVLANRDVGEDAGEEDKGVSRGTLTFMAIYTQ